MKALLDGPPRQLAAVAALVAAALVVLGSVVLLFVSADDFGLSFGDRLGVATSVLTFTLPVLLAVALVLRDDGAPTAGATSIDDAPFDLAASVVGAIASVLLLGRLLADLVGGDGAPLSGFGVAGRLGTLLVDLAALTITAALTWWCLERRAAASTAPAISTTPATQTPPMTPPGAPAPAPGVVAPPPSPPTSPASLPTSPPTFRSPPAPDQPWGQHPPG